MPASLLPPADNSKKGPVRRGVSRCPQPAEGFCIGYSRSERFLLLSVWRWRAGQSGWGLAVADLWILGWMLRLSQLLAVIYGGGSDACGAGPRPVGVKQPLWDQHSPALRASPPSGVARRPTPPAGVGRVTCGPAPPAPLAVIRGPAWLCEALDRYRRQGAVPSTNEDQWVGPAAGLRATPPRRACSTRNAWAGFMIVWVRASWTQCPSVGLVRGHLACLLRPGTFAARGGSAIPLRGIWRD